MVVDDGSARRVESQSQVTSGSVIPPDIYAEIVHRLQLIEQEEHVRILFAIESGSRAWGFASPDSDFDVRFVYARPREWYLRIDMDHQRDVIERGIVDDIDLNGWDVLKALRLMRQSNPALVEWLQSPITYMEQGDFRAKLLDMLPRVYALEKGIYHYRSMASSNFRDTLSGDSVKLKKYFYVLRPVLCVRWIEQYGTVPPIEFGQLLHLIEDQPELLAEIHELLRKKAVTPELGKGAQIPVIHQYLERELSRLAEVKPSEDTRRTDIGPLNDLFRQVIAP